jgi:hypothetical protein
VNIAFFETKSFTLVSMVEESHMIFSLFYLLYQTI